MAEAIQQWPKIFGYFLKAGFKADPRWANEESDGEDGSSLLRRRFTSEPQVLQASVKLPKDLLRVFEAWYTHKLKRGAEWFQVDLLIGRDLISVDARITGGYSKTVSGQAWKVSFGLLVEDWPILSEEILDAILAYGASELVGAGEVLHTLIHERLPGPAAW